MDERSLETPVQVQVLVFQGLITTANVVGDQTVHFHVSSGKSYRLNVSGTGIQTITTAYFDIEGLEQRHTETVHVRATGRGRAPGPARGAAAGAGGGRGI